MMLRKLAVLTLLVPVPSIAGSQTPIPQTRSLVPLFRLAVGTLNPDDPFRTTFAFGVSAGLEWGERRALLIRVVRQSQNRTVGPDLSRLSRTFVTLDAEVGGNPAVRRKQQVRLRAGLGVLLRPGGQRTALVGSGGVAIRYEVAPRFSFVGQIEDDIAALPRQEYRTCDQAYAPEFGYQVVSRCEWFAIGGARQHNFGLIVAMEWRP